MYILTSDTPVTYTIPVDVNGSVLHSWLVDTKATRVSPSTAKRLSGLHRHLTIVSGGSVVRYVREEDQLPSSEHTGASLPGPSLRL